jgi:hypothetical protein
MHRGTLGDDEAPGWDAIDTAIRPLVGEQQPLHWGRGASLPGQGGLWGVSAYRRSGHWFFVTYGLSELFTKTSDDRNVSGWGEELTMRIAAGAADDAPPAWAPRLLARLGERCMSGLRRSYPAAGWISPTRRADDRRRRAGWRSQSWARS